MAERSKRLELILELAQKDVDAAADVFTQAKNKLKIECQKLDEILDYLNGYAGSCEKAGTMLSPEQMIRQRAFVNQLSQAQSQQRKLIAQSEQETEGKKGLWQQAHLKQRAMQDLAKRMADEEQWLESKEEEKLLDEWAQQQYVRSEQGFKLH